MDRSCLMERPVSDAIVHSNDTVVRQYRRRIPRYVVLRGDSALIISKTATKAKRIAQEKLIFLNDLQSEAWLASDWQYAIPEPERGL